MEVHLIKENGKRVKYPGYAPQPFTPRQPIDFPEVPEGEYRGAHIQTVHAVQIGGEVRALSAPRLIGPGMTPRLWPGEI